MKWAKKKEELIWWTNSSMKHQGGITILMYLSIKIHNQPNNIFTSSSVLKSKEKITRLADVQSKHKTTKQEEQDIVSKSWVGWKCVLAE